MHQRHATLFINLKPRAQRKRSADQMSVPFREELSRVAGITVTHVGSLDAVAGDFKQLRLNILGPNFKQLDVLSVEAMRRIRGVDGIVDLDTSLKAHKPTIALEPHRNLAADLGVGVGQIGATLRPLLAGEKAGPWRSPDDQNYDISVRLAPENRGNLDDLSRLMLPSSQMNADGSVKMVPLRQVADIFPRTGANQINRRDLNREVELSANVVGRSPGQAAGDIKKSLDALVLAIVFIYMILASQFASFL